MKAAEGRIHGCEESFKQQLCRTAASRALCPWRKFLPLEASSREPSTEILRSHLDGMSSAKYNSALKFPRRFCIAVFLLGILSLGQLSDFDLNL
jgi:hypothetical protein